MARRKIREEKSKFQGTKQELEKLNTAAHNEEHAKSASSNPGGTNYVAVAKWGWGE